MGKTELIHIVDRRGYSRNVSAISKQSHDNPSTGDNKRSPKNDKWDQNDKMPLMMKEIERERERAVDHKMD